MAILGRRVLTQHHNLPYAIKPTPKRHATDSPPPAQQTVWEGHVYEDDYPTLECHALDASNTHTCRRRATQWKRWQEEIILLLIKPYMNLMATTDSLRHPVAEPGLYDCKCGASYEILIKVIQFSDIEEIILRKCNIHKIALQLLQCGLFLCAPLVPTLAVDIKTLEFVRVLFLRVSLNVTAISSTLEDCLGLLGYKLETIVS